MKFTRSHLESLKRPELQALCKEANIKANGKSADLIVQLLEIEEKTKNESEGDTLSVNFVSAPAETIQVNSGEVHKLRADFDTLLEAVSQFSLRLSSLETQWSNHKDASADAQQRLTDLEKQLNIRYEDQLVVQTRLEAVEQKVAEMVAQTTEQGNEETTEVAGLSTTCETVSPSADRALQASQTNVSVPKTPVVPSIPPRLLKSTCGKRARSSDASEQSFVMEIKEPGTQDETRVFMESEAENRQRHLKKRMRVSLVLDAMGSSLSHDSWAAEEETIPTKTTIGALGDITEEFQGGSIGVLDDVEEELVGLPTTANSIKPTANRRRSALSPAFFSPAKPESWKPFSPSTFPTAPTDENTNPVFNKSAVFSANFGAINTPRKRPSLFGAFGRTQHVSLSPHKMSATPEGYRSLFGTELEASKFEDLYTE